jgi:hypothetical protein
MNDPHEAHMEFLAGCFDDEIYGPADEDDTAKRDFEWAIYKQCEREDLTIGGEHQSTPKLAQPKGPAEQILDAAALRNARSSWANTKLMLEKMGLKP